MVGEGPARQHLSAEGATLPRVAGATGAKLASMSDDPPTPTPAEPDLDENGVDLAQIRAMLARTPAERLAYMTEWMNSLRAIRERNGTRGAS
jgi:hypothetical protein